MSKKVLITGACGFVGSWLLEEILNNHPEYEVVATRRRRSDMDNVKNIVSDKVTWADCNVEDYQSVETVFLKHGNFDKCFHLAAQSFVKFSWDSPAETLNTNIIGTLNVLENVRRHDPECVVLLAGSSEEYGFQEKYPLTEELPLRPLSPYAVSKVAEENLGYQYFKSYGLKTILTRAFNHDGPRRGEHFVTSSFSKQIVEIEKGKKPPVIYHGNLHSFRDYTDARDMVKAYWMATELCEYGKPYNICSGKVIEIEEVLNILLSHSKIKIEKIQDPNRMRPSDLINLQGCHDEFVKKTGWIPVISVEKMLKDTLDYWREKL